MPSHGQSTSFWQTKNMTQVQVRLSLDDVLETQRPLRCPRPHISRPFSLSFCTAIRLSTALQENRQEWCCWLPSRMVAIGLSDVRAYLANHLNFGPYFIRIGDWYPERNIFQILIAITSGGLHLISPSI